MAGHWETEGCQGDGRWIQLGKQRGPTVCRSPKLQLELGGLELGPKGEAGRSLGVGKEQRTATSLPHRVPRYLVTEKETPDHRLFLFVHYPVTQQPRSECSSWSTSVWGKSLGRVKAERGMECAV